MSTTLLQYRIDKDLKKQAEQIFEIQGIKPSQVISILYTEVARTGKLPFMPSKVEIPNKRLAKAIREAEKGIGLQKFTSKEGFFESLKNLK